MTVSPTLMLQETEQAASVVAAMLKDQKPVFEEIATVFASRKPALISTCARGSSDHAATFFKYLAEIRLGLPVAAIGPSVASVYDAPLQLGSAVHFTVSQSGASPDIVAMQRAAKKGGAVTVAVVNVTDSPLGNEADIVLGIGAGPEKSVAATKSFIASAAALAGVIAAVSKDSTMQRGLDQLPEALGAVQVDAGNALENILAEKQSLFIGGRGPSMAIALEAALKAKETSAIHAEAFSLAELMHGPMRLVEKGFPIVAFVSQDQAYQHNLQALKHLESIGGNILAISPLDLPWSQIKTPATGSALLDPLVSLGAYYRVIEAVTRRRGFNPDKPLNLNKVTETV